MKINFKSNCKLNAFVFESLLYPLCYSFRMKRIRFTRHKNICLIHDGAVLHSAFNVNYAKFHRYYAFYWKVLGRRFVRISEGTVTRNHTCLIVSLVFLWLCLNQFIKLWMWFVYNRKKTTYQLTFFDDRRLLCVCHSLLHSLSGKIEFKKFHTNFVNFIDKDEWKCLPALSGLLQRIRLENIRLGTRLFLRVYNNRCSQTKGIKKNRRQNTDHSVSIFKTIIKHIFLMEM